MASIILASASPRRAQLLRQLGLEFSTYNSDIDETVRGEESAADFVQRMALDKARFAWQERVNKHNRDSCNSDTVVIGADTCIVFGEQIIGKPGSRQQAVEILKQLSAKRHRVFTAVCLLGWHQRRREYVEALKLNCTDVVFKELSAEQIHAYWESGEPADKAGAYAIQGKGAVFIQRIEGSYSAVMGLPLFETGELLADFGYDIWA